MRHQRIFQEKSYSSRCSTTFSVEQMTTKKNVWQTPNSYLCTRESLQRGQWSLIGPGSEKKWYCISEDSPQGVRDKIAERVLVEFAESGCPIFRATTPLSRGQFKSKGHGKLSIHYAADLETVETMFRKIVSANQLSLYGAVAEICEEYETLLERTGRPVVMGQSSSSLVLSVIKTEVLLDCDDPANQDLLLQQNGKRIEKLSQQEKLSKFCLDAGFLNVVEIRQYFRTKDTADLSQFHAVACREYTLPREEEASQPKGWIQGNTKIGPVLEVAVSHLHGKYGVEIRIWSLNRDNSHSWVRIFSWIKKVCDDFEQQWNWNSRSSARRICVKTGCERFWMPIQGKSKTTEKRTCRLFTENRSHWKKELDRYWTREAFSLSEIISLDTILRLDGLPALELWDLIVSVFGNISHISDRTGQPVNRKNKSHNKIDVMQDIDSVPSNVQSSNREALLYVFEDNEAVIKMIMKGRRPTMRHVSRTHRVALDWLFDRINLDSKIQIKYIDTKNQLADIPTKGNFTRDEWNHLLSLFNISHFSSTICSAAMAKRVQQESGEERVTAKSRPMMNLTARMTSIVSSSTSTSPGKTWYGCQDPGKSVVEDDRSGKLDRLSPTAGQQFFNFCELFNLCSYSLQFFELFAYAATVFRFFLNYFVMKPHSLWWKCTSGEGSTMARPRSMNLVTAKPRPTNWVSHNLLSARKNSKQDLSDSNNQWDAKAEQGGVSTCVWKQMRDTSQNPAEYSQVKQQEDTQNEDTWKQQKRSDSSDSRWTFVTCKNSNYQ